MTLLLFVRRYNPVSPGLYLLAYISWPISPGLYLLESLMSRRGFEGQPRARRSNAESRTAYHRQRLLSPLPSLTGSALKYRSVAR